MALPTTDDKRAFVNDLIDSVRKSILSEIDDMPEEWDGHELRRYIADWFENQTTEMPTRRLREYRKEVLTRNL